MWKAYLRPNRIRTLVLLVLFITGYVYVMFYSETQDCCTSEGKQDGCICSRSRYTLPRVASVAARKSVPEKPKPKVQEQQQNDEPKLKPNPKPNTNLNPNLNSNPDSFKLKHPTNEPNTALQRLTSQILKLGREIKTKTKGPLLLTIINRGYLPFVYNWLCHTKQMEGLHESIIFLVQSHGAEEELKQRWPNLTTVMVSDSEETETFQFGTAGYLRIMVQRTQLLNTLIQANESFILFETDFIWFENPVSELLTLAEEHHLDIVGTVSTAPDQIMCGAFIYFRNTTRMRTLWAEVTRQIEEIDDEIKDIQNNEKGPESQNEQIFLNLLLDENYMGVEHGLVNYTTIVDGQWYRMSNNKRSSMHPKAIHNNFLASTGAKIKRFKNFGQWVLDSNENCDENQVKKLLSSR